jgi:multiple sugar transport system substrate-binding protein
VKGSNARRGRTLRRGGVVVTAVAIAAALTVSACSSDSGSSGGKVKINFSWWGDATRAAATEKAVAAFEAKNPNIDVVTQYAAFNAYNQKIATQIAGGNAPDVQQLDWGNQSQFAQRNVFADLSSGTAKIDLSGLDPSFAATGKSGDKQVAVPFGQATESIVVDTDLLAKYGVATPKPGWTWQDLGNFANDVHAKSNGKVAGMSDPGSTWAAFLSWQFQNGRKIYNDDGTIGFTQSDVESFWNFTTQYRKSGGFTAANLTSTLPNGPAEDPLAKGLAASEWDFDSIFGSHQAATGDKMALLPLPTVNGKTGMYAKPSMLLSVYSRSKHQKQAAALVDFLVNSPVAAAALGTSRGLFPNTAVRKTLAAKATDNDKTVADFEAASQSLLDAHPSAPPKGDGQLLTLMQRIYSSVSFGQTSVSSGAKEFMSQAKSIIGG